MTIASTSCGISGFSDVGGDGRFDRTSDTSWSASRPTVHGGFPARSSYATTPHENWSARPSRTSFRICSGAM